MRLFTKGREHLHAAAIEQILIPTSVVILVSNNTQVSRKNREVLLSMLPDELIATRGFEQMMFRNGSRLYIWTATEASFIGSRPNLVLVDNVLNLNTTHLPSFIRNITNVCNRVLVSDGDRTNTDRIEVLRKMGFEFD